MLPIDDPAAVAVAQYRPPSARPSIRFREQPPLPGPSAKGASGQPTVDSLEEIYGTSPIDSEGSAFKKRALSLHRDDGIERGDLPGDMGDYGGAAVKKTTLLPATTSARLRCPLQSRELQP